MEYFKKLFGNAEKVNEILFEEVIKLANKEWIEDEGKHLFGVQITPTQVVYVTTIEAGSGYTLHVHPDNTEMLICYEGEVVVNKNRTMRVGSVEHFASSYAHSVKNTSNKDAKFIVIITKK